MAWGLWRAGMGAGLDDADARRLSRMGVRGFTTDRGLALFDTAVGAGRGLVVPIDLDLTGLAGAPREAVPGMLRALVSGNRWSCPTSCSSWPRSTRPSSCSGFSDW